MSESLPRNARLFCWFRVLFNARFYYPVFAVFFVDMGLTLDEFAILNVAWAASIVIFELPLGALADRVGRRPLVVGAAAIMVVVFFGFVLSDDPLVKMTGVGLGTAILVDATIVRAILVPSTMALLGDLNAQFVGMTRTLESSGPFRMASSRCYRPKTRLRHFSEMLKPTNENACTGQQGSTWTCTG